MDDGIGARKVGSDSPRHPPLETQVTSLDDTHGPKGAGGEENAGANAGAVSLGGMYNPRSLKFWAIMGCNFLALFLVALDRTILATAVPRITDEFHSLGDVGWYASSYMLTTSASQLLFGRIYKFYPTKWTFLVSIIIFEIGSAICGAAPSSTIFIVGRSIAGLGSAGIFTGCMLMFMMVPLAKRPMFQGLFGMTFGVASVMGPLVGGAFTGGATWRWCFYINLPIGLVAFICMILWWTPPQKETEPAPLLTHIKRLDPLGTLFFLPAVVALLLALQWGGSTYAWKSGIIIGLFVAFAVLVSAFAAVQILRPETATIPPRVITQRSVFFATFFTFFIAGGMLMCVYFLPIWFQTAQGVDPLQSGIYTLPLVLSLVVSSALSGVITSRIGYYMPSMLICPVIMAVGEGLMSTFSPTTDSSRWIAFQFLTGFGLGFGMQTGALAIQTVLSMADVSTGIAINMFAQQLGGAVFSSVGQAILSNVLVAQLTGVDGLKADAIVTAGITNLLGHVRPEHRGLVIGAYNFACTRIFLAAVGLSCAALLCAFGVEWRSIKKPQAGSEGHKGAADDAEAALPAKEGKGSRPTSRQDAASKRAFNEKMETDPGVAAEPGAGKRVMASGDGTADDSVRRGPHHEDDAPTVTTRTNGLVTGTTSLSSPPTNDSKNVDKPSPQELQLGPATKESGAADESDKDSFVSVTGDAATLDGRPGDSKEGIVSAATPSSDISVEKNDAMDGRAAELGRTPDRSYA